MGFVTFEKSFIKMAKKAKIILIHLISWCVLIVVPHLFATNTYSWSLFVFHTTLYVAPIIIFYLHFGLVLPLLFIRRRYRSYFLALVALCALFFLIFFLLAPLQEKLVEIIHATNPSITFIQGKTKIIVRFVLFFISLAASGVLSYSIQSVKREQLLKELEKQHAESNLQLLKSQLSPHFLFNAMNSLYSLALKKSDDLPNAILTFSILLRYSTYDSTEDYVDIEKEIEYLHDYVNTQQLRLSPESVVNFEENWTTKEKIKIAPMVLIPFVENAFKHGRNAEGNVNISISINVNLNDIVFHIQNEVFKNVNSSKDSVHGIGIQNVKSRLQIIYGTKHSLQISETDSLYSVTLKINI